jgi:D-glycero-D-manno-heptose 1,7-bisphosphate phosphatase
MFSLTHIDDSWTLLLDRDGVINVEKNNDYIFSWNEFKFYPYSLEALAILATIFPRICIVTNQKGVGKGLMTASTLADIHSKMIASILAAGGRIDKIYYCSDVEDASPNRKPQPGMALQAKADFPAIDFSKTIVVGNRPSDMRFGRNAGVYTAYIDTTHPDTVNPHPDIDIRYKDLLAFAHACKAAKKM